VTANSAQEKILSSLEQKRDRATESPQSFSLSSDLMDCDDSLGSLDSIVPSTIGEELQRSIKALSPALLIDEYIFSGTESTSDFAKQRGKVLEFLRISLKNYEEGGKKSFSSALYVCGGPGTGKVCRPCAF